MELAPVPRCLIDLRKQVREGLASRGLELGEGTRPALLRRTHKRRPPDPGEQVRTHLLPQKPEVVVTAHLVAHDPDTHVVLACVAGVLPVDAYAAPGGLGDEEGDV